MLKIFKKDPFLGTTLMWGFGLACMIVVVKWAIDQITLSPEPRRISFYLLEELITCFFVLFGAAYMVKFVGRRPALYTAISGVTVAAALAFFEFVANFFTSEWTFQRFLAVLWVAIIAFVIRGFVLAAIGAIGGWIVTRGRVPIEIEVPGKKELEAARKAGKPEPAPRITTPLAAMPGSSESNAALLQKLDKDPEALLPEKERRRMAKANSSGSKLNRKK